MNSVRQIDPTGKRAAGRRFPTGSLYHWSFIGFLVVTLPVVVALLSGLLSVSNYTEKSQQTLFQTVRATEGGRMLLERLISMERSIRQYQVLKDQELYSVYQQHHAAFVDVANGLRFDGLSNDLRIPLEGLLSAEHALHQHVEKRSTDKTNLLKADDLQGYETLTLQARALLQIGSREVVVEAELLAQEADRVRRQMLLWVLLALPLALLLGLLFAYLLTRPIKRIERVISELGAGRFDQPIVIHGPSDLEDLGHHLDWMRRRLMEVEDEKERFIRNISHELKTPLATLREGADLLEDEVVGELNCEQLEIVQLMKIGTLQLNGLVENLLEYQRVANRPELGEPCQFDFAALIRKTVTEYRLLIRSKQLEIVDELVSIPMQGDREAVRMMVGNLLSNAIKFSPEEGSVRLTLSAQNEQVILLVEDQGEGVSMADQSKIYQEFYQGSNAGSWSVKGSGLGLALVRDTVERHRGTVTLLKPTDIYPGARFRLTLPLTQPPLLEVVS
ncbi:MAG: HAMP domain-containing histidine kinase [Sedimenticola thiotaurini]|uniref:histidine kinase n=1 Tax=Sedimenticola thiotaurini TaxID=1543721 RepID=A0A558D0G3_9GAMM|nr:MAG: HAMP domain-containing histidine kinase [Sedimenticola thiotaurini]